MAEYEVFLETTDGQTIAQIPFEQIDLTLGYNNPGKARLSVLYSYFSSFDLFSTQYQVRIRRDQTPLFSGPISSVTREWDGTTDVLSIDVVDDLYLLSTRLVVPVPSGPPYTAADSDVRTGAIETIMHQYVYYHAGAGATTARRISGLTQATDLGRGATVTARGRFVPLLDLLKGLATLGSFGIRVIDLEFQVYQPTDKSTSVFYSSEMNNLATFSRSVSAPRGNYVYVGGGGEGTSRVIVETGDSASISRWGRIEMWKDQRNTSDTNELLNTATTLLSEQSQSADVIQFSAYASLDQVSLGDIVSVVYGGVSYPTTIRQITVSTDGVGEDVKIASGPDTPAIYQRLETVEQDLTILEVR